METCSALIFFATRKRERALTEFLDEGVRAALDRSIELNRHLLPVDAGLVASARAVADRIDEAVAESDGQELTKALYLIPHVNNLLREMLATPASRVQANLKDGGVSDKKAKLTALRGGKAVG